MNINLEYLIENSNKKVKSYKILKKTECMRQISDKVFEYTNHFVEINQIYDAELVFKRNNNYYLFLNYDDIFDYEVYIPILFESNSLNITII